MFPAFFQYGLIGVAATALLTVGSWFIRKEVASAPTGTVQDPLPPLYQTPHRERYVPPVARQITRPDAERMWHSAWLHAYGEVPPPAAVALLAVHTELATGGQITNHNPTGYKASRFYIGTWTVERVPEWNGTRPVIRWQPVRAYTQLVEGGVDWLTHLPAEARAALIRGDADEYARVLHEADVLRTPPREWAKTARAMSARTPLLRA